MVDSSVHSSVVTLYAHFSVDDSFRDSNRLRGALNLAGSADDTRVIVNNHGLLSLVAFHVLKLEHCNRAHIHADRVAVAFAGINFNADHRLAPTELNAYHAAK